MSDNKLLAENTIRRFMKLANTEAMTDSFLAENAPKKGKTPEDEAKEVTNAVANNPVLKRLLQKEESVENEDTLEENEEIELEENLEDLEEQEEDEEMEMDMEMDPDADVDAEPMDAEPEMGAADMSLTEEEAQLLIDLGQRLAAAMGGEAPAEEPEMDMDLGAEEEMPEEEPEMEDEEEPAMRDMYENQEDLVNEVLKRVTKRLVAEKLKNRK